MEMEKDGRTFNSKCTVENFNHGTIFLQVVVVNTYMHEEVLQIDAYSSKKKFKLQTIHSEIQRIE